jgi:hypothetical protein
MQCRICQYELPQNVTFCPNCGTQDLSSNQEVPAAYPTPQPYTPYPAAANYSESAPPPPPPMNPYTPYGMPQQAPYAAPMPMYAQPQPQQPKSNRGAIIAVVTVLIVLALIGGGIVITSVTAYNNTKNAVNALSTQSALAQATLASNLTALPTVGSTATSSSSNAPDSSQIDTNAATMIISAQSSSGIDSNYLPIDSKAAFTAGDTVYVTFETAGSTGYIMSKWFLDDQDVADSNPVADTDGNTAGYFSHAFSASGNGIVGIYWCTQADCSDAALAQVVNVTVS